VTAVRTELPAACENIIGRALAKSPADRFQSADEFRAALAALSATGSSITIAVPGSGLTRALTPAPAARSVVVPEEPTVMLKMPVRRQLSIGVLMAAVVLAGVPTAYLVWQSRHPQLPPAPAPAGAAAPPPALAAAPAPSTSDSALPRTRTADSSKKTGSPGAARDAASHSGSPPGASSDPKPSRPTLPSISFSPIKLLELDGDKPHDRDVLVTFTTDAVDVRDGSAIVRHARYLDMIGLFQSHSREPRWAKPDGTPVPLAKIGGRLAFLKGASDWITIQTPGAFIALHVADTDLPRLVSELETRTGTHVVRTR
jgi:hypothetical protein